MTDNKTPIDQENMEDVLHEKALSVYFAFIDFPKPKKTDFIPSSDYLSCREKEEFFSIFGYNKNISSIDTLLNSLIPMHFLRPAALVFYTPQIVLYSALAGEIAGDIIESLAMKYSTKEGNTPDGHEYEIALKNLLNPIQRKTLKSFFSIWGLLFGKLHCRLWL